MKTILVFDRPFTRAFTSLYRVPVDCGECRLIHMSDFRYRDDVGYISGQYQALRSVEAGAGFAGLDHAEIIRRCRYLKTLEFEMACKLINAAWVAIGKVFQDHKVDAFIGPPMDNYHLDLIDQYCVRSDVFRLFPLVSFLPGQIRMTRRGEYLHVREPEPDEVEKYWQLLLTRKFRPTWLNQIRGRSKLLQMYLKERGKKVFFESMKMLKRDPYSFHYNTIFPSPNAITVHSLDTLQVRSLFSASLADVSARATRHSKVVFFALQFAPEASLNYNIQDSRIGEDYRALVTKILDSLPQDVLLIVKEHPDIYGYRPKSFYEVFQKRPNVMLVDVAVTVQEIFDIAEFILVTGSASTGAEAVIKGKTVISLGGAFYGANGAVHEIRDAEEVERWSDRLVPIRLDEKSRRAVVSRILSNSIKGDYKFVRTANRDLETARAAADGILGFVMSHLG